MFCLCCVVLSCFAFVRCVVVLLRRAAGAGTSVGITRCRSRGPPHVQTLFSMPRTDLSLDARLKHVDGVTGGQRGSNTRVVDSLLFSFGLCLSLTPALALSLSLSLFSISLSSLPLALSPLSSLSTLSLLSFSLSLSSLTLWLKGHAVEQHAVDSPHRKRATTPEPTWARMASAKMATEQAGGRLGLVADGPCAGHGLVMGRSWAGHGQILGKLS